MIKLEMPGTVLGVAELVLVTEALQRVSGGTARCCLTGGCLRDAYHGCDTVKDVDIAVWNLPKHLHHAFDYELVGLGFHSVYDEHRADLQPSESDSERIDQVFSYTSPWPRRTDVLVYNDRFVDMEMVVRSHDHNINMFGGLLRTDHPSGECTVDVFYPWHNMGRTFQMRHNVSPSRIRHVRAISERLGWDYWPGLPVSYEQRRKYSEMHRSQGLLSTAFSRAYYEARVKKD